MAPGTCPRLPPAQEAQPRSPGLWWTLASYSQAQRCPTCTVFSLILVPISCAPAAFGAGWRAISMGKAPFERTFRTFHVSSTLAALCTWFPVSGHRGRVRGSRMCWKIPTGHNWNPRGCLEHPLPAPSAPTHSNAGNGDFLTPSAALGLPPRPHCWSVTLDGEPRLMVGKLEGSGSSSSLALRTPLLPASCTTAGRPLAKGRTAGMSSVAGPGAPTADGPGPWAQVPSSRRGCFPETSFLFSPRPP